MQSCACTYTLSSAEVVGQHLCVQPPLFPRKKSFSLFPHELHYCVYGDGSLKCEDYVQHKKVNCHRLIFPLKAKETLLYQFPKFLRTSRPEILWNRPLESTYRYCRRGKREVGINPFSVSPLCSLIKFSPSSGEGKIVGFRRGSESTVNYKSRHIIFNQKIYRSILHTVITRFSIKMPLPSLMFDLAENFSVDKRSALLSDIFLTSCITFP